MRAPAAAAARLLAIAACGTGIAACGRPDHQRFEIDGVPGGFCVPDIGYIAPGVWFVPEDPPGTPHGFSFDGCDGVPDDARPACTLPDAFDAADVMPAAVHWNRDWKDLKGSVDFASATDDPATTHAIDPGTGFLVQKTTRFSTDAPGGFAPVRVEEHEWIVWNRALKTRDPDLALHADDRLVAHCMDTAYYTLRLEGMQGRRLYGCRRHATGRRYQLEYQFTSPTPVPTLRQMRTLDAAIFAQVDAWACP